MFLDDLADIDGVSFTLGAGGPGRNVPSCKIAPSPRTSPALVPVTEFPDIAAPPEEISLTFLSQVYTSSGTVSLTGTGPGWVFLTGGGGSGGAFIHVTTQPQAGPGGAGR